ncbi:MAG: transglycosylase domain-containing protein, partial [Gemmatimonadales bacterium]
MTFSPVVAVRTWWQSAAHRRNVVFAAGLAGVYVAGLGYGSWTRVCAGNRCPSISALDPRSFNPQQTSKIYAADGRLITELGLERRSVLTIAQMPAHLKQAFIAVEDKRFYSHNGIDYLRFFGALKANILTLSWSQGFSTITMQLARNVFPEKIPRTKRLTRKLMEARVAIEIEHAFSKDQILEMYLNQIPLGGGSYGVEAAAQAYFGKSARDVNVAEAAMLAALPKNPEGRNPRKHPGRAVLRRNVVLNLMRDQGYLSAEEAEYWKAYPLALSGRTDYRDLAPYFVEWVRRQLDARFGRDLYERGMRVYTTLDLDMQEAAERAVRAQLDAIEAGAYSPNGQYPHPTYAEYVESNQSGQDRGAITPYL